MARVRRGTADEMALATAGYTASGEGEYSRKSAHGKAPHRFANRAPIRTPGHQSLDQQIGECERRIEWMECELKIETDPQRRIKLSRDLQIRGAFLTRLLIEKESVR